MKITKNQLKELVQQSIEEMIEGGPGSGRKGGGDTTGGPSYANVPKGAKTSKDAKKMKKKKKSLGTSIASKFQKQIDKYNKARKQTPKGLKRVTKEGKLTEKVQWKKDKKIKGKWYTNQGTHKHQTKANVIAGREWRMGRSNTHDTIVVKEPKGYTIYVRPLKEGKLTESQVAKTILQQLGGNKFIAMTGAKNFGSSSKSLQMKIGRNSKSISHVVITLKSSDLYDMEFIRVRGTSRKVVKKVTGVYADMLGKMFTKYTGMNVRL